jgi:RimJ/RimL family protein N-acetyltransferase
MWWHLPTGRHGTRERTAAYIADIEQDWAAFGLGYWAVRPSGHLEGGPVAGTLIGIGGCAVRHNAEWNLHYRFAPAAQGRGFAAEMVTAACDAAADLRPDLPVVASLLGHNSGSKATASRAGLEQVWRGPDPGNPDATAVRLIYADRPLTDDLIRTTDAGAPADVGGRSRQAGAERGA